MLPTWSRIRRSPCSAILCVRNERVLLVLGSFEQMELEESGHLGQLGVAAQPHLLEGLFRAFLHAASVHRNEHHPSHGPGRRHDVLACAINYNMAARSSSLQVHLTWSSSRIEDRMWKVCTARPLLPGNSAVCYRSTPVVHLENVGYPHRFLPQGEDLIP